MRVAGSSAAPAWAAAIAAAAALAATGGWLAGPAGAAFGLLAGAVGGGIVVARRARRSAAVRARIEAPFPPAWREWLGRNYDHYRRLPESHRAAFEGDVAVFLATKRISGVSMSLDDSLRLAVAASAATLSLGWRDYDWHQLTEVLVYAGDFDRDYRLDSKELAGQAHPWGTVLLSAPALLDGFADPDDGFHVGLHEFAHLLDLEQANFGGLPAGLSEPLANEWIRLAEGEMARMREERSALDPYGAHDPVEFLAVAIESFFEQPLVLRSDNPRLYAILAQYFNQDPARWDEDRGYAPPTAAAPLPDRDGARPRPSPHRDRPTRRPRPPRPREPRRRY